jgi:hypothetical protein
MFKSALEGVRQFGLLPPEEKKQAPRDQPVGEGGLVSDAGRVGEVESEEPSLDGKAGFDASGSST